MKYKLLIVIVEGGCCGCFRVWCDFLGWEVCLRCYLSFEVLGWGIVVLDFCFFSDLLLLCFLVMGRSWNCLKFLILCYCCCCRNLVLGNCSWFDLRIFWCFWGVFCWIGLGEIVVVVWVCEFVRRKKMLWFFCCGYLFCGEIFFLCLNLIKFDLIL